MGKLEQQQKGLPENLLNKISEFTNKEQQGGFIMVHVDPEGSVIVSLRTNSEIANLALRQHLEDYLDEPKSSSAEKMKSEAEKFGIPKSILNKVLENSSKKAGGYLIVYIDQKGDPKIAFDTSSRMVKKGLKKGISQFLESVEFAESSFQPEGVENL